jgi:hypothetical protein
MRAARRLIAGIDRTGVTVVTAYRRTAARSGATCVRTRTGIPVVAGVRIIRVHAGTRGRIARISRTRISVVAVS